MARNGKAREATLAEKVVIVNAGGVVRIREGEVVTLSGWSRKKIQADRAVGRGIPFIRDGGSIFYDLGTVISHLRATV